MLPLGKGGRDGNERALKEYLPQSMVARVSRSKMMVSGNIEESNSDLWKLNEERRNRLNGRKHFLIIRFTRLCCCQEMVAVPFHQAFNIGQREQTL